MLKHCEMMLYAKPDVPLESDLARLLDSGKNYKEIIAKVDELVLKWASIEFDNNQVLMAKRLGISRITLRRKLANNPR